MFAKLLLPAWEAGLSLKTKDLLDWASTETYQIAPERCLLLLELLNGNVAEMWNLMDLGEKLDIGVVGVGRGLCTPIYFGDLRQNPRI